MFTGIVEEIGQIVSIDSQNDSSKISIKTEKILNSATPEEKKEPK